MPAWIKRFISIGLLTTATTLARAGIAQPVTSGPGGHVYQLVVSDVTWTQANAAATAAGGYLLTIGDSDEQSAAEKLLTDGQAPSGSYWFELDLAAGKATPPAYTHWFPGEPNDLDGTESFASILWSNPSDPTFDRRGLWNDLPDGLGYPQVASVYPDLVVKGFIMEFKGSGPDFDNGDHDPLIPSGNGAQAAPLPPANLAFGTVLALAMAARRKIRR